MIFPTTLIMPSSLITEFTLMFPSNNNAQKSVVSPNYPSLVMEE